MASLCHKQRTGKGLKISEEIVLREEMYEEEDDLPSHLRYNLHLPQRFQDYATLHTAMHLGINPNQDRIHREFEQHFGSLMAAPMSGPNGSRLLSSRAAAEAAAAAAARGDNPSAAAAALFSPAPQQDPTRRGSANPPISPAVVSNAASFGSSPAAMQRLQSPAVSPGGSFYPNNASPASATNSTFAPLTPVPGLHHQRSRSMSYSDHANMLAAAGAAQPNSFVLQGVPTGQRRKSRHRAAYGETEPMFQENNQQMARTPSDGSSVVSSTNTSTGPPMKRRRSEQSNHSMAEHSPQFTQASMGSFTPRLPQNIMDILHSQQMFQNSAQSGMFDSFAPFGFVPPQEDNPMLFSGPAGHRASTMSEPGLSYSPHQNQQPSNSQHKAKSFSRPRATKPKKAAVTSPVVKTEEAMQIPKEEAEDAAVESDTKAEPAMQGGGSQAYQDVGFNVADFDDDALSALFLQDNNMNMNHDFDVGPFDMDDFVEFPASQPDNQ